VLPHPATNAPASAAVATDVRVSGVDAALRTVASCAVAAVVVVVAVSALPAIPALGRAGRPRKRRGMRRAGWDGSDIRVSPRFQTATWLVLLLKALSSNHF
jgi:hypothetical protein